MLVCGASVLAHLVDQQFIGRLPGTAQREAQQFAAEVAEQFVLVARQVIPHARLAGDGLARQFPRVVDRAARGILFAPTANRVEPLQRQSERIEPRVATRARRVAAMFLQLLAER